MQKWLIGVDEAGRGPLAGPVAVGVVCVSFDFDWGVLEGVTDSKKLSEKKREAFFVQAQALKKEGKLDFAVAMVSAKVIDEIGIVRAVHNAMKNALHRINISPQVVSVKLDGGLHAPAQYIYQETIIRGDGKERVIGLASIMAKVTRDRYMARMSKYSIYMPYTFDVHKGYGTQKHRAAIKEHGLCDIHRRSFCRKLL